MDGVLVIDKPEGPTSHDVVAFARRALGESRIGHTGTLDPLATGVLPLAIGRATRLVRFLTVSDKEYEATIRFGLATDSYDITGTETGRTDQTPSRAAVLEAIESLRGEYLQMPPPYSAKKVAGRRAYELARRDETVALTAAPVRVARADLLDLAGNRARVAVTCSAGFYVRSFAHALGERTGAGACLEALRRMRSGEFQLEKAITLEDLQDAARVSERLIPMERLLPRLPAVRLTEHGRALVAHGRELGPGDFVPAEAPQPSDRPPDMAVGPQDGPAGSAEPPSVRAEWVRLLGEGGSLAGLATGGRAPGSLHPAVVLI